MISKRKLLLVVLLLGLLDSAYLTVEHYLPSILVCPNSGIESCVTVLDSSFSTVFGIPIAIGGLTWFLVNIFFVFRPVEKIIKNIWLILGAGGVLYSVVAMYIIGKICLYCSALDLIIIATILLSMSGANEHKRSNT